MSSSYVDQGYAEVLGGNASASKSDAIQLYAEVLGPIQTSHSDATQEYSEVLGGIPATNSDVNQLYAEVLGLEGVPPPPGSGYDDTDEQWFNL